ncbi:hypothetical protein HCJ06_11155 [Listeria welshimeri]|nr:hypothetical protein [Listeria welshimeri]MBC1589489.1 hypothetical protein [Listeria welshimeri]MBC1694421.1 hypothetical protein [Listeria welshimeri]
MEGMFTIELIFALTSNPKFQEVAELVYWEENDIIDCPENSDYVYAIDEGNVTQYAERNSFWGKGTILGFTRDKTKIQPLCKTVAWKIPLTYVADNLNTMGKVKMEDLIEIEMNFLNQHTNDCMEWFVKKMPVRLHSKSWKIAQDFVRQEVTQVFPKNLWKAQLDELKAHRILYELGHYLEIDIPRFHNYLRHREYDLLIKKNL